MTRLDLALEQKRNTLKGTLIGAVIGFAAGFAWKVDPDTCHDPGTTDFCSRGEAVGGGALGLGAVGALNGFLVKTDRFTTMDLQALKQPLPVPARQGQARLGFAVRLRF